MTPDQITKKVNQVLCEIEDKTLDGTFIVIKGSAILPSEDVKFFTPTQFAANWLLKNKHRWTHLCDASLITPPSTFPVILHSVPTTFDPTNPTMIVDLCSKNNIQKNEIHSVRWLGNPATNKQAHGSIVIHLLNKELCKKLRKAAYSILDYVLPEHTKRNPPSNAFNA
jgi:hypothetical protein